VTTVKEICLGVAVAGVVAGAGSVLATAVAYAEPAASDSQSSSDAGPAKSTSTEERRSARGSDEKASEATDTSTGTSTDADTVTEPKIKRSSRESADATETSESDTVEDSVSTAGDKVFGSADKSEDEATDKSESTPAAGPEVAEEPAAATPEVEAPAAEPVVKSSPDLLEVAPATPKRSPNRTPLPVPVAPATPTTVSSASSTSTSSKSRSVTTADIAAQITDPTTQHVLVIGVDGTNLGRVLDNPANANFLRLMETGITAAASIIGHTTISNPSWTAILTGVWDNKSGVINNIFTPQTYNVWPTVFNQLEGYDRDIQTKAIADWQVIADIAGAGSIPADEIVYVEQGDDDPLFIEADAAVTAETVKSILGTESGYEDVPNFLFTYTTGVDEAGHQFGGASPEYAEAIARTNTNVGLILDAVAAREAATCAAGACEDWTIIMVTDHGHQPQQGFGHGFQSPSETSTFVIVDGPGFDDGQMNLSYQIVDITPTVVSLFGLDPTVDADGVPLPDQGGSQVDPVDLEQALQDAIDMYGWPDIQTNVALSVRTIVASIPYFIDGFVTDITAELQSVADSGIPLVSALAAVAVIPVQFFGDSLVAVTNAIAHIVGRLTGAGAIPPSTSQVQPDGQPYPWIIA
jgi:Type I phosphodiesterase / nucleotide pyrophosphatase